MTTKQPREFRKDGYEIEITGPARRCQVWINGQPVLGLNYFRSLRAARNAAFGPHGWTKRHPASVESLRARESHLASIWPRTFAVVADLKEVRAAIASAGGAK